MSSLSIPGLGYSVEECSPEIGGSPETRRRQEWRDNARNICATGVSDGCSCAIHFPGLATYHYEPGKADLRVCAEGNSVNLEQIEDTFYRSVAPLVIQFIGHEVLHASAVVTEQGLIVICGRSGSGKSSFAYGLSQRGYAHWADDAVTLAPSKQIVRSKKLKCPIRLRENVSQYYEKEGGRESPHDTSGWGEIIPTGSLLPVVSIIVLNPLQDAKGESAQPKLSRLPPSLALRHLMENAYCFTLDDNERKKSFFQHYVAITSMVTVYQFKYHQCMKYYNQNLDYLAWAIEENAKTSA